MHKQLKAIVEIGKVSLSEQALPVILNAIVKILGETAVVERAYIFQSLDEEYFSYKYEWASEDVEPFITNPLLAKVKWDDYAFIKTQFIENGVYTTLTKDITNIDFKNGIEMQGILSLLFVPIFYDNFLWGFIGLDDCKVEKIWTGEEIDLMCSVANYITALIKRKELEKNKAMVLYEMQQQREYFQNILENIPADIVVFNDEHKYEYVNKSAIKDVIKRKWIIGKDDFAYCKKYNKPLSMAEERRMQFDEVCISKKEKMFKESFSTEDGTKTFLRIMRPILNEKGDIKNVIGYGINITTLVHTENRLLKLEEAINNSPEGIALLTQEGLYTYMNRAHEDIFGYNQGELIGKSWEVLYREKEINEIKSTIFPLLEIDKLWEGEIEAVGKNGDLISQEIKLKRLDDRSLLCVTKDISEMKKNISLIKHTNNKLDLAIRASNLAMWEWDIAKDELKGNDIFNQYIGNINNYSSQKWIQQIHPDDRQLVLVDFEKSMNGETEIIQSEYRLINVDKSIRWVFDTGTITKTDKYGQPEQMVGCMIDITELKKAREDINVAFNKQKELIELKSKFISMASHEFRTPLSNIRTTIELIQLYLERYLDIKNTLSNYQIDIKLQDIIKEIQIIEQLMSDIFTIGKIENNTYKISKSTLQAEHYIQNYFKNIDNKVLKNHTINLTSNIDENCYIEIDKSSMDIVFNNIISNAIKYSPNQNTIDVNAYVLNNNIHVEIIDYGIGIPETEINNLFMNFYRSNISKNINGIGLGLAIAKHFIDMNGCFINISSKVNEYTKVTIRIPIM